MVERRRDAAAAGNAVTLDLLEDLPVLLDELGLVFLRDFLIDLVVVAPALEVGHGQVDLLLLECSERLHVDVGPEGLVGVGMRPDPAGHDAGVVNRGKAVRAVTRWNGASIIDRQMLDAEPDDVAIVLVDARKGVLTQTRRHSFILSLIGVKHVVLAVKGDAVVGCGTLVRDPHSWSPHVGEIRMVVSQDVRGQGVGYVEQRIRSGRFGGGAGVTAGLFRLLRQAWPGARVDCLSLGLSPAFNGAHWLQVGSIHFRDYFDDQGSDEARWFAETG